MENKLKTSFIAYFDGAKLEPSLTDEYISAYMFGGDDAEIRLKCCPSEHHELTCLNKKKSYLITIEEMD